MVDITDWYDLDDIRNDTQGSYILQNDLDQDTAGYDEIAGPNANSGKGFKPIGDGSNGNQFEGTLDGNGNQIRDLKISRPNENKVGLIRDHNGTLKNLLIVNANIEGQNQVALTGSARNTNDFGGGSIEKVGIDGTSGFIGEDDIGSITGDTAARTNITECYSLATVEATNGDAGGITTQLSGSFSVRMDFNHNYYAGNITATGDAYPLARGGLSDGSNNYWDKEKTGITNNYEVNATALTTSEMTGSNAPNNMTAFDFTSDGNWKVVTNTYPDLKNLKRVALITDWFEFDNIRNALGRDYVLNNDLDSTTEGYEEVASTNANGGNGFDPIGNKGNGDHFAGSLDGDGNVIRNLKINRSQSGLGVFESMQGGTVKNIEFREIDVTGTSNMSCLISTSFGNDVIDNVFISGTITGESGSSPQNNGGFVGSTDSSSELTIKNCTGGITINGVNDESGGVIGIIQSATDVEIIDTVIIEDVTATGNFIGGFAGLLNSSNFAVKRCGSFGTVTVKGGDGDFNSGGFAGYIDGGNVRNCYANNDVGEVNGAQQIGGFVSTVGSNGLVENCYTTGDVLSSEGNTEVGQFAYEVNGTTGGLYYDETFNFDNTNNIGTGFTTSEMTGDSADSNLTALDFGIIWEEVRETQLDANRDYYPILQGVSRPFQLRGAEIFVSDDFIIETDSVNNVGATGVEFVGNLVGVQNEEIQNITLGFDFREVGKQEFERREVETVNVDNISFLYDYRFTAGGLDPETEYEVKAWGETFDV